MCATQPLAVLAHNGLVEYPATQPLTEHAVCNKNQ